MVEGGDRSHASAPASASVDIPPQGQDQVYEPRNAQLSLRAMSPPVQKSQKSSHCDHACNCPLRPPLLMQHINAGFYHGVDMMCPSVT